MSAKILLSLITAGFSYLAADKVQEAFPSSISEHKQGDVVKDKNGTRWYVVGYHGSTLESLKRMQEKGLEKRPFFFGDLATAQSFSEGATGLIVCKEPIEESDLRSASTLACRGMGSAFPSLTGDAALKVRVVEVYPVNADTKKGLFPSIERAIREVFKK